MAVGQNLGSQFHSCSLSLIRRQILRDQPMTAALKYLCKTNRLKDGAQVRERVQCSLAREPAAESQEILQIPIM